MTPQTANAEHPSHSATYAYGAAFKLLAALLVGLSLVLGIDAAAASIRWCSRHTPAEETAASRNLGGAETPPRYQEWNDCRDPE